MNADGRRQYRLRFTTGVLPDTQIIFSLAADLDRHEFQCVYTEAQKHIGYCLREDGYKARCVSVEVLQRGQWVHIRFAVPEPNPAIWVAAGLLEPPSWGLSKVWP